MMDLYVNKASGTCADTQLAVGLTSSLAEIYRKQYKQEGDIYIYNKGYYYHITISQSIDIERVTDEFLESFLIVLPLDSQRQRDKLLKKGEVGRHLDGFPYDNEVEKSRTHREQLKKLPPSLQMPEARLRKAPELQDIIVMEPRSELEHYRTINQMKIASSFNELALRWDALTPSQKRFHIQLLLDLFQQPDNDIATAVVRWQQFAKEQKLKGNALVTALQIVNPIAGKGANRAKSGELMIGNLDSFWLLELLKFRGFMEAAAPILVRDEEDRKIYVIQPRQIKISFLQDVMKEFRAIFWSTTAIKLDIMASLRFVQAIMEQYRVQFARTQARPSWLSKNPKPTSLAAEFSVTFYKYLGSAHATMNLSTIGLPTWLPEPTSAAAVASAMALLDEHIHIIRDLHNSQGEEGEEEYELLRAYRDFLSAHDLRPFWKFTTLYAGYLISQREKEKNPRRQVRQLTYTGLEQVIMNTQEKNPEAVEILKSEGFQHIADAIRYATVFAQYRRYQHDDRRYEIYYGLEQELMRKARYSKDFTIALARFLARYNDETSLEEEKVARSIARDEGKIRKLTSEDHKKHNLRYITTEDDFKQVVELINKYGSELVGAMLIACGYSFKGNVEKSADS